VIEQAADNIERVFNKHVSSLDITTEKPRCNTIDNAGAGFYNGADVAYLLG